MYVHSFIAFDPCMCVHVNRQPKPYAVTTITSILAVTIHIACIHMYIHVSISFNPSQHLQVCTFTPKSNHLWTSTYMSAFVPSTFQLMHGHISIVNTALSKITTMRAYISVSIGFNASHHVCTLTTTCMSKHIYYKVCLHVRTFLHCLRSLHVRTCQSSTQSLCDVVNIRCHNSHRLYRHVIHVSQPKSTSFVYKFCLCTFTSKSNHLWTCAFNLSTNAWVHVNHQHCLVDNLKVCIHVSIGFNESHHHVCTSTTTCMYKHIYVCLACMSTCTHIPSLLSILACTYCMCTSTQCLVDNNLNMCIHNPSQHLVCTSTCLHTSTTI